MIRTFNYTGRKKIPRNQLQISIVGTDEASRKLDATIKLDNLALPPDASVYVEAYSRAGVKRYPFGKVSKLNPSNDLSIPSAILPENMLFRVLVVDESFTNGRIVAVADRLGRMTTDKGTMLPILPVETDDLGRLVWKIDFGGDRPTLILNYNIPDVKHIAANEAHFFEYVYPAVLKEIFTHMIWIDGIDDLAGTDNDDWRLQWLRFADQYVQAEMRPILDTDDNLNFDPEAARQWVDDVVKEFCTKNVDYWEALLKELEVE